MRAATVTFMRDGTSLCVSKERHVSEMEWAAEAPLST
jgi:hypothetical protein